MLTELQRGSRFRDDVAKAIKHGTPVVEMPRKDIDTGDDPFVPDAPDAPLAIRGHGIDQTIWHVPIKQATKDPKHCDLGIALNDLITLEDMTVHQVATQGEVMLIGNNTTPFRKPGRMTIRRVKVLAGKWGFYVWNSFYPGPRVLIDQCEIWAARHAVGCYAQGHKDAVDMEIRHSSLYVMGDDPKLNTGHAGGAIDEATMGLVVKGGYVRMYGGLIHVRGSKNTGAPNHGENQRAVAVTDRYHDSNTRTDTRIELHNVTTRVLRGSMSAGAKVADIDVRFGSIAVTGGSGSGPNGEWVK